MLPASIAARLKSSPETTADSYSEVTVLFADMVGFTPLFSDLEPAEALDWLNEVFSMFDRLVAKYGLEKIRTRRSRAKMKWEHGSWSLEEQTKAYRLVELNCSVCFCPDDIRRISHS